MAVPTPTALTLTVPLVLMWKRPISKEGWHDILRRHYRQGRPVLFTTVCGRHLQPSVVSVHGGRRRA